MSPTNPLFALAGLLVAVLTARLMLRVYGAPAAGARFATIDGLRGYLAYSVFLHHASVWFYHLHGLPWANPPSRLFVHLGQSSVSLFFMITGFLFANKLLAPRSQPVDWMRLYVGRVLRLVPLYLVAMLALFLMVGALTGWQAVVPLPTLARDALKWLGFTVLGNPDLNGFPQTWRITAGVTWSLLYEWMFYLALPVLSACFGRMPRWPWLLPGAVGVYGLVWWYLDPIFLLPFGAGIAAAGAARWPALVRGAGSHAASAGVLLLLGAAVVLFDSAYAVLPQLLLGLAFLLVANGASLFGALTHPASRLLGEQAYSLYLLHGLVLFALFSFGIARPLPPAAFWGVVLLLAPLLLWLCHVSYRYIETPPQRWAGPLLALLRRRAAQPPDRACST